MLYYLCVLMLAQFVQSHFIWVVAFEMGHVLLLQAVWVVVRHLAFRVMWGLGLRQYTGVGM